LRVRPWEGGGCVGVLFFCFKMALFSFRFQRFVCNEQKQDYTEKGNHTHSLTHIHDITETKMFLGWLYFHHVDNSEMCTKAVPSTHTLPQTPQMVHPCTLE
jgi:hypothetical protein